jgi:hypothetical protein
MQTTSDGTLAYLTANTERRVLQPNRSFAWVSLFRNAVQATTTESATGRSTDV